MSWKNIKLILLREVRDQLRDRRTLFMIAVLPLLLYPLLGVSYIQLSQFLREHPSRILVLTETDLPASPPLVADQGFDTSLFEGRQRSGLLEVETRTLPSSGESPADYAQRVVRQGEFDAVVFVPADFSQQILRFHDALKSPKGMGDAGATRVPSPEIFHNSAQEKSQIAYARVNEILLHWSDAIGRQNLKDSSLPEMTARPFKPEQHDVAEVGHRDAAIWSKILPFVLVIWALTGAFYPAVDLCAGEKERGTLETLLSSPARRAEIVCGKLATVMLFSMSTAVLNLICMGLTGAFVVGQAGPAPDGGAGLLSLGAPPAWSPVWLLAALVPISALFSALCLGLAAFARSTKEGQYYLMPLVMVMMPLLILPMRPGADLDLGRSLIPVTGVVLLLKTLLEGNYLQALPYIAPVAVVTLGCCWFAVRWAVEQFNKESVLFREGERFEVGLWMRRLVSDRDDLPSPTEAIFCGLLILTLQFFMNLSLAKHIPETFHDIAVSTAVTELTVILTPALIMAVMLSRRPNRALSLRLPPWWSIPAAILLAVTLHPAAMLIRVWVIQLYPPAEGAAGGLKQMEELIFGSSNLAVQAKWVHLGYVLLFLAALPAVCEELAFRGFILSGLRSAGHTARAVVVSSIFFGLAHGIIQQSLIACLLGFLLGFIAIRTGSIVPCILFHVTHNGLVMCVATLAREPDWDRSWWKWIWSDISENGIQYSGVFTIGTALVAVALIYWFPRRQATDLEADSLALALPSGAIEPAR